VGAIASEPHLWVRSLRARHSYFLFLVHYLSQWHSVTKGTQCNVTPGPALKGPQFNLRIHCACKRDLTWH
jgi:hypothetical protein